MLRYVSLCYAMLRYVTLCYVLLYEVMLRYGLLYVYSLFHLDYNKKRILVVTDMSIKSRLAGRFSFVPYSYSQYPFGAMRYFLSEKPSMKEDILGSHNMVLLTRLL